MSTVTFSNNDIDNFLLFLRKVVYLYEFMDEQENENKTSLLEKVVF